jgi:hypothetical protein
MAPLDDILGIDGNRHVFERLRAWIEAGRRSRSPALGPRPAYPLWAELVQLLIREAVKRGLASQADRARRGANAVVSCFHPERVDK